MKKQISLGGQALIEGVMMKTATEVSAAARKPSGKIITTKRKHVSLTQKYKILNLPFIRGILMLAEMLVIGIKMLNWSADQQAVKKDEHLGPWETGITLIVSLALTIVLFVLAPYWASAYFVETRGTTFNLIDGLFRIGIFIGYVWFIGLFKDVKRMYEYHGAEHMSVHCHEAGKKLIVKNVRRYSPVHPRCGTSLLMFVIVISILLFSLIKDPRWYVNVPVRIVLIPVVAGISYELLKLSARFQKNIILKIVMLPGLLVQKITTRKPDNKQIEVAIAALKKVA